MKKALATLITMLLVATMLTGLVACDSGFNDELGVAETPTSVPTNAPTKAPEEKPTETPTQVSTENQNGHEHDYVMKLAEEKYLKEEANCASAATYYYSCGCGEQGTDSFTEGDINKSNHLGHTVRKYSYKNDTSHKVESACSECKSIINEIEETHGDDCIICLEAGIYDSANKLLATWDTLVKDYGWDVEKNYDVSDPTRANYYITTTSSPYYILNNTGAFVSATKIVISSDVNDIGSGAFYNCSKITTLVIKDSENELFTISQNAFARCTELTTIWLPNTVKSVDEGAFASCSKLKEITLPNSISRIGSGAFINCSGLKAVYYEGTLAEWMSLSFANASAHPCSNGADLYINGAILSEVEIADTATIKAYTFYGCNSLVNVSISKGVRYIRTSAFMSCANLKSVKMNKDSVVDIGSKSFYGCTSLNELVLADTLNKIGEYAFYDCDGLVTLILTENIDRIEKYGFGDCNMLSTVYFNVSYRKFPLDHTFIGCDKLTNIEYCGTMEEWYGLRDFYTAITNEQGLTIAGLYWDDQTGQYTVNCTDGVIYKKDIRETRTHKSFDEVK